MQKKLIALAIAGLASSAAFAQSNVTVYGVADVYFGNTNADGLVSKNVVNNGGLSGSRIGFKGTEDLGNGLKALFTLEYSIAVDDNTGVGTGSSAARQQFVGLTGGFGTALAGRLQTAGYDFAGATNALHGTAINPVSAVTKGFGFGTAVMGDGTLIGSGSRASNAIAYVSPSFGGVTVAYNHARLSEAATVARGSDSVANLLSATYKAGPAVASLIFTNATNVGAPTRQVSEWALGGGYDFGVVNLKASYQSQKVDGGRGNDKAWQVSGLIPVTAAGKVALGYAKNNIGSVAGDQSDSNSWTLAYLHSLSKRTTLYTGYQRVSNDNAARLGTALQTANTVSLGGDARAFVAGVNHSF